MVGEVSTRLLLGLEENIKSKRASEAFIKFKVDDGCSISLWYNSWHPNGFLYPRYSHFAIYDATNSINAKLVQE